MLDPSSRRKEDIFDHIRNTDLSKCREDKEMQTNPLNKNKNLFLSGNSHSLPDLSYILTSPGCQINIGNNADAAIGLNDEDILQSGPCPLQRRVERLWRSSANQSENDTPEKAGLFQWILRISGLCFFLLCILLLLVVLGIPCHQVDGEREIKRESILTEENLVSFVNTKFKAPATDVQKNLTSNMANMYSNE